MPVRHTLHRLLAAVAFLFVAPAPAGADGPNLVANGSFEEEGGPGATPAGWAAAGNRSVKQELSTDRGAAGRRSGKLVCTEFRGDAPDCHAMVCQVGRVALRGGRWHRLTFQAKAEGIRRGAVSVALVDTNGWRPSGLSDAFTPGPRWQPFEILFRATADLPAATSRLQFWFQGTGTLWLDDVVLVETETVERWLPEVGAARSRNLLPNASFECGVAGWGGYGPGLPGWAAGLWRLEAQEDRTVSGHGEASLRIDLAPGKEPVYALGWYEPVERRVRCVLVANLGWVKAAEGETWTLSAWLRADREGVPARLVAREAEGRALTRNVVVGREGARQAFSFQPRAGAFFVAAGLDLSQGGPEQASLWVDAVQLERGGQATVFTPRRPVEAFLETDPPDGMFRDPAAGLALAVRAWNDGAAAATLPLRVAVTDFRDRPAHDATFDLAVPSRGSARRDLPRLLPGRRGFFRARLEGGGDPHALRCVVADDVEGRPSPFGMNHAYPYAEMQRSAVRAGVAAWRDWSAQWNVVEPERGRFDFAAPARQVERTRAAGGEPIVLLPFPASSWSTTADPGRVEQAAGRNAGLRARLPMAFAPRDEADWGRYVERTVGALSARGVRAFEILNEPIYTDYALPRAFGYGMEDYLRLLRAARDAAKRAAPEVLVVGGIGTHPDAELTRAFLEAGGAALVDVVDVHLYAPPRRAESYAETWEALQRQMARHGGRKPVWVTEWGCYADDDPPRLPFTAGDTAMNLARWPSEQAQAEHLVEFAAVGLCHGVERFFLHAGTTGEVNGPDAGNVFFEHQGRARKAYAAVAAFVRMLDGMPGVARMGGTKRVVACAFAADRGARRGVGLLWSADGKEHRLRLASGFTAFDLMGNALAPQDAVVGDSPIWLVADAGGADAVLNAAP